MVTRVFPPQGGGGVQRMVKFATYLRDHNWLATVVAPQTSEGIWQDTSQMELLGAQKVIRIGAHVLTANLVDRLARRLAPIDAFYSWAGKVNRKLEKDCLLADNKAVFTSGPPHSTHLVGYRIKEKFGIPWIADFRDHYTLGPEYRPISWFHRSYDNRFEHRILQNANCVICNTRTNRRDLIAKFGVKYASKVKVIYNGFDRNDLIPKGEAVRWPSGRRNYLYLGGLRGSPIDDTFLSLLQQLQIRFPDRARQIALRVVGDASRRSPLVDELMASGVLTVHEPVPANSLGRVLEAADACVAWQRNEPKYRGTIGGKIFDYLSSGKPIFSLGQPNGEIDRLLRRLKRGISCLPEPPEQGIESFLSFDDGVVNQRFSSNENSHLVERFSRQHQACQLAAILGSISV